MEGKDRRGVEEAAETGGTVGEEVIKNLYMTAEFEREGGGDMT